MKIDLLTGHTLTTVAYFLWAKANICKKGIFKSLHRIAK
jgi:hypothetical protein